MTRTTKTILCSILALALAATAATAYCLSRSTGNSEPTRIYLPLGTTTDAMADSLCTAGVVNHSAVFKLCYRLYRPSGRRVPAGSYLVQPHTRILPLARQLAHGQQAPIRLTLGRFRMPAQLNDYLSRQLEADNYGFDSSTFHLVRPDTYEVYWTTPPDEFLARMQQEYARFWQRRGVDSTVALCGTTLTRRDIVVLASIVEEETNHNPEKPLVASVYLNRLKRGMPLQADPTVKYAVGDFTLRRILHQHLATESPYNTYLHTGLPPSPICLPSAASVDAVLAAPQTDYLYFCASEAMDGTHRFAATLAQHNANANAFHRALNARGIR
ncbi:MAG: endolytic transglycosylase MltG [Bacteroidales bacterium]|nr:endolytic transglycosylase MltG [Bacteroidales bacterium]